MSPNFFSPAPTSSALFSATAGTAVTCTASGSETFTESIPSSSPDWRLNSTTGDAWPWSRTGPGNFKTAPSFPPISMTAKPTMPGGRFLVGVIQFPPPEVGGEPISFPNTWVFSSRRSASRSALPRLCRHGELLDRLQVFTCSTLAKTYPEFAASRSAVDAVRPLP